MHQLCARPGYISLSRGVKKAENDQDVKFIQKARSLLSVFGCKYSGGLLAVEYSGRFLEGVPFFLPRSTFTVPSN